MKSMNNNRNRPSTGFKIKLVNLELDNDSKTDKIYEQKITKYILSIPKVIVAKRKKEEIKSHRDDNNIRTILNSIVEGVIVTDKKGHVVFANPFARQLFGAESKDVSPKEWASTYGIYYSDRTTLYPFEKLPLARAMAGEKLYDQTIFLKNRRHPDGVYINVSASPFRNPKGSIEGGAIIFRDITESKLAEIELMESQERLKAVFKGFPIPSYIWRRKDDDFILIDYNNAAEIFTKGVIKNFIGISFKKMYENSPDKEEIQSDILNCFNQKITFVKEMPYKLKRTDELKELKVSYVFVPRDLVMMHAEDITTNKIAEQELRKLSNAVEQTADSVVITDKAGIIEYVNPAFVETTGYSREEAIGQTPRLLKSYKQSKAFYKKLWKTILTDNSYHGTVVNKKKNGDLYVSQQTITPMKDKNGNITHFVSVLKDVTELKKQQEQESRLQIARELQQRLLKSKITIPGFDIAGKTYSAIETCGDYFDFISMKDGSIGIVIGDVCGHGIGAALIMVQARAYLRMLAKLETDPGIILTQINQVLADDLDETHFVTLTLARLDPEKKLLEYASAGHIPGYLIKRSETGEEILTSTGIPLGIVKDYFYQKSGPIKLTNGDILAFITDGIIEARLVNENEFGYDRMLDVIKTYREASAEQIIERLYLATRLFVKNQSQEDDVSTIICKVNF
jgi:PAS domain S-box-containing protein